MKVKHFGEPRWPVNAIHWTIAETLTIRMRREILDIYEMGYFSEFGELGWGKRAAENGRPSKLRFELLRLGLIRRDDACHEDHERTFAAWFLTQRGAAVGWCLYQVEYA